MPRLTLNLVALLAAFSIAPAIAGHGLSEPAAGQHESDCPYERAELAALAVSNDEPTIITLTDPIPPESSLFSFATSPDFLTP